MKKIFFVIPSFILFLSAQLFAQNSKEIKVPEAVRSACKSKYPDAKQVTWEKEKGNYEANWGGKSGEENSVQFTPEGQFIEIVRAQSVSSLPKVILNYVHQHYKKEKIKEAGKVTDAQGNVSYEVEINKKDIRFDENGHLLSRE